MFIKLIFNFGLGSVWAPFYNDLQHMYDVCIIKQIFFIFSFWSDLCYDIMYNPTNNPITGKKKIYHWLDGKMTTQIFQEHGASLFTSILFLAGSWYFLAICLMILEIFWVKIMVLPGLIWMHPNGWFYMFQEGLLEVPLLCWPAKDFLMLAYLQITCHLFNLKFFYM